ncbi:D-lyxose/D-mannose family sugar isomerase [Oscillospiraceae bacterium PP1C4]
MISKQQYELYRDHTLTYFEKAHIVLTDQEKENIEVADFGLGDLYNIGLQLIQYVNTERCCSKDLVLLPGQICPEHIHPTIDGVLGKEETFRCRTGQVYLYVGGKPTPNIKATIPEKYQGNGKFTVFHEIILNPGEQYTLDPCTLHWFQGGPEGCIVSEFSTASHDDTDIFTDTDIVRVPVIA